MATGTEVLAEDSQAKSRRRPRSAGHPRPMVSTKDRSEYLVLDPSVADDLEAIRPLHPGDPVFIGADDADTTWLVAFHQ